MNQSLRGPREMCEDMHCSLQRCNYNRNCMIKCFREKRDAITRCCKASCPQSNPECIRACADHFRWGVEEQIQQQKSERKKDTGTVLYIVLTVVFMLLLAFIIK